MKNMNGQANSLQRLLRRAHDRSHILTPGMQTAVLMRPSEWVGLGVGECPGTTPLM
jgi:hypothetical protein